MERAEREKQIEANRRLRQLRYTIVFVIMVILLAVLTVININTGSVKITVGEIARILFLRQGDPVAYDIIWSIRFPRIVMAAILGGALSLAGFLLQTYFNNPIAGPFILGISSGAKMCVALCLIYSIRYFGYSGSALLVIAAFGGSLLSTGFVLLLARRIHSMSILLVGGVMVSYICSAITDFVVTFAEDSNIVNLRNWSLGSFSGVKWGNVYVALVLVGICALAVFLMAKPISALQLGENYAQSMGVNVRVFRVVLILLSSLLSACVTAFAGPISFVGIAVPQLVKRGLNTAKPIVVIPATFLGGAVFCMFCDLIARTAFAPTELNISTVTAVFGAPVVIAMILKRNGGGRK
ncbi:MAG: iron ABC transporter permease [Oscillospiraceae bacterium]|nr:iron ABC transporter permease [Oscillospiraceae bacterium]